jgi:hypothetical protein
MRLQTGIVKVLEDFHKGAVTSCRYVTPVYILFYVEFSEGWKYELLALVAFPSLDVPGSSKTFRSQVPERSAR